MSCTETHSRREWKFCSPANRFGVGRPMNDRREPSVPPRIGARPHLEAGARDGLAGVLDDDGVLVDHLAHVAVGLLHVKVTTRPATRPRPPREPSSQASFSFSPAVTKSRTSSFTVVRSTLASTT
jgi:hypothetical protein